MVVWNELPGEVVEPDTLKKHLKRHLDREGDEGYRPNTSKSG